jgi:hypothetical protein
MTSYLFFNGLMQELSPFQQFTTIEKFFLEMNLSETKVACGGHVC